MSLFVRLCETLSEFLSESHLSESRLSESHKKTLTVRVTLFRQKECDSESHTVGEKKVSLQEIRSGFEFVPGLFGIVLREGYLHSAWPRTVLILIEFKFIVPEL